MNQQRTRALRILALCACASALACSEPADRTPESSTAPTLGIRNLILVCLDTLRADHMSLYGYERETTPNLDRFAEQAVVFERSMANASSTRPSHQALFQSRPASAATRDGRALAEVLSEHGFRTAAFTGGGNISGRLGFDRGFDLYEESDSGLAGSVPKAASWVREHRDERFLLFLHTYDIHLPYDPPEPWASMYGATYQGEVRGSNTRPLLRASRGLDQNDPASVQLDDADRARIVALYDGGIRYTDDQLEHLFNLIEELDLLRDTLVVFFADHGEEFWEHGSVIHSHTLYRELLNVPLILKGPGLEARRVEQIVSLMDVAPTLLELLGLPTPEVFEGRSLVGLMEGAESGHRAVVSEQRSLKSWLQHPWKLVRGAPGTPIELYDIEKDPGERNNVAQRHSEVVTRLNARLDARIAGHADAEVLELEPGIEDPEHLERLRALGYIE